jgi:hypothetical protein
MHLIARPKGFFALDLDIKTLKRVFVTEFIRSFEDCLNTYLVNLMNLLSCFNF